jgi:hypothetical protein
MKVAIRAEANNKWVCADDAFQGKQDVNRPLQANRPKEGTADGTNPTGWETYQLWMQDANGAWVPFAFPVPPPPVTPPDGGVPPGGGGGDVTPPSGLPEINSRNFVVYGSDPACLDFPATAVFNSFGFVPGAMTIHTTGTDNWPMVDIDGTGPSQAATLWVLENIGGIWYATGAERLRPEQLNGDKPEGNPSTAIGVDWLYDPSRWGPMAGYNPRPGEIVGLICVAGSTRSDNQTPINARTSPLWVYWPGPYGSNPVDLVTESSRQFAGRVAAARR